MLLTPARSLSSSRLPLPAQLSPLRTVTLVPRERQPGALSPSVRKGPVDVNMLILGAPLNEYFGLLVDTQLVLCLSL